MWTLKVQRNSAILKIKGMEKANEVFKSDVH
jgi:hypothetical protein